MRAFIVCALLLVACGDTGKQADPTATTTSVATAVPVASARPPADDLDAAGLSQALSCPKDAKDGPCAILQTVAEKCEAWGGVVPSGDGRYVGRSYKRSGPKLEEGLLLLRARTITLMEAQGALPSRMGVKLIPTDLPAYSAIGKAVSALARHDVPGRGNVGVDWVKTQGDFDEAPAAATTNGRVVALLADHAFLCRGKAQQLLFVQPASGEKKGDGMYAELWPVTW